MWDSRKIADLLQGELIGDSQVQTSGCIIDSRQAQGGETFFALAGENVDGHRFIEAAWDKGANLVIAEKDRLKAREGVSVPQGKALIQVKSGLQAMQMLAQAWRQELGAKVVGITGSNGKTTTKDMVAAVLARKYRVYKNKENHNNELGLPLTILNAPEGTEILILEMGMRGLGQIKALCNIAKPNVGVITNIGTTHMELLGSQKNIAEAKWELVEALPTDGIAVLNAEDYWSVEKARKDTHTVYFYGLEGSCHPPDLRGENLVPVGTLGTQFGVSETKVQAHAKRPISSIIVELPLPGEHNVLDALAALSVGLQFGVSLTEGREGLIEMELSHMRLELHRGIYKSTLISDVYNANPVSMQASVKVLRERGGTSTLAILGEMYELGEASESGHYAVGQAVAELGITELITVGELAEEIARGALNKGMSQSVIHPCKNREEAILKAKEILAQRERGTWVLLKASRGMKMEEMTKALREG
jgi:UDP-N-acetylmuramoyl-tripeptide--D-alanyl-D-alanine ligase